MHEKFLYNYEDFKQLAKSAIDLKYPDDAHRMMIGKKRIKAKFTELAQERELTPDELKIWQMAVGRMMWDIAFMWFAIEES